MSAERRKRPASELPLALFTGDGEAAPAPPVRPGTVVSGTLLVFARAVSSIPWMVSLVASRASFQTDYGLSAAEAQLLVKVGLAFEGTWMLMLLVMCWLVWRGSNAARRLVLFGATVSIISAAVGYFASGEEITVKTTLLTLALDILILLALSSRDARTWSRSTRGSLGTRKDPAPRPGSSDRS